MTQVNEKAVGGFGLCKWCEKFRKLAGYRFANLKPVERNKLICSSGWGYVSLVKFLKSAFTCE